MLGNVLVVLLIGLILIYNLFRKYKYNKLKNMLYDYSIEGLVSGNLYQEYNSVFAQFYLLMPFPEEMKYPQLYKETKFVNFKKKIRFIEYLLLFIFPTYVGLLFVLMLYEIV